MGALVGCLREVGRPAPGGSVGTALGGPDDAAPCW